MHALADWIAKLVQILKINICIHVICSIIDQADCNCGLFMHSSGPCCTCIEVDLFLHSSGPFGGPLSGGGGGGGTQALMALAPHFRAVVSYFVYLS